MPDRLKLRLSKAVRAKSPELLCGLPELTGSPILLSTRAQLFAHGGKLVSGTSQCGCAVYAASFLSQRKIIIERALLSDCGAFRLILIHELFHFVWPRLGNGSRSSFQAVLLEESNHGARGHLGESSGVKKELLMRIGRARNPRLWSDYVCECFCDTAAWFYAHVEGAEHVSLASRWQQRRKAWFELLAGRPWKC